MKSQVQTKTRNEKVGRYLQETREANGITQKEIADQLGYSTPQFVSNWERGFSPIPASDVIKILKLYGADIDTVYRMTLEFETKKIEAEIRERIYGSRKKS